MELNDKILIAGSRGMVGSAIFRKLKSYGFNNLICASRDELDLINPQEVESFFNRYSPDIVIVAAAKVGGIYANNKYPYDFILDNLKIQINLIENAFKKKVKRLLFLGSSCIYPKLAKQPIREEELLNGYLEKTNDSYAIAKISGIKLCEALRKQHNFDAISLMPTNLYGEGDNYQNMNSHVIPSLIRKFVEAEKENSETVDCWGSGKPLREFLHVDDLADACLYALSNWFPSKKDSPKNFDGESLTFLNVGSNQEITIKDLAELIAKKTNFKGKINWDPSKPDGTPRKLLDSSKLNNMGWFPKIDLDTGLEKTIKLFKINSNKNNLRL